MEDRYLTQSRSSKGQSLLFSKGATIIIATWLGDFPGWKDRLARLQRVLTGVGGAGVFLGQRLTQRCLYECC